LVILSETSLDSFNLLVSILFSKLNLFDEIVWLLDSSVWLNFDNIPSDKLVVADDLLGHNVSYINDAVFILVGVVIEEDVLCVIVSLINQKKLSHFSMMVISFVALVVILDGHARKLFESFKHTLILLDRVRDHINVLILVSKFVIDHLVQLIKVVRMTGGDSLKEFGILDFIRESKIKPFLAVVSDFEIFGTFSSVEFNKWGPVSTGEARMKTLTELVELPFNLLEVMSVSSEANGEFSFLLFQSDKSSEERWDQMVLTLTKHSHHHFLFIS